MHTVCGAAGARNRPKSLPLWIRVSAVASLFLLLSTTCLHSQTDGVWNDLWRAIKFERVPLEDGLSQAVVLCILQDSKGFMWFGTQDGLNRYDGYNFTVYKSDPNDSSSLASNFISSIYEGPSGVLWVGTLDGGLHRYDREKDSFERLQHNPDDPHSLNSNQVFSVFEDHGGVLWVGTHEGLNRLDGQSGEFEHYVNDPEDSTSLSQNDVWAIYEDRDGVLWVGTARGLNRLDEESNRFRRYLNNPDDPHSLSHNFVRSIDGDRSGALWIATHGGGLNHLDRQTGRFTRYDADPDDPNSLSSNLVRSVHEDRSGALWVATYGGGLNRFDPSKEIFTQYKTDPNNPYSLSSNFVRSLYEDRSGTLWFGTNRGLNRFGRGKEKFARYECGDVWSIYGDRSDVLWVGTVEGGLYKLDRRNGVLTNYRNNPDDPNSLSDNDVMSIYEGDTGLLWIGTNGGGLNKFDPQREKFTHYRRTSDLSSLSDNRVMFVYEDHRGVFWVATFGGGLNEFDPNKGTFKRHRHDDADPNSLSNDVVVAVVEDRSGRLWVGTYGGLNVFDRNTGTFTRYRYESENPNSLSNDRVLSVYESRAGVLWVGTAGGLDRVDRVQGDGGTSVAFKHYREDDGLPNDVIYGILEDDHGDLWLSTNKGLSRFSPDTERFRNYDVKDGLQSNEFNSGAYHEGSSGEMYFGGIYGLNAFYPDSVKDNPHIPPIVITDFQISNKSVRTYLGSNSGSPLKRHITESDEVVLSYQQNVFSFEFAALDFSSPEKNQYAYMMVGFDRDWIYSGTRRLATYTNLDPGEYTFRVKGSNNDGIWNERGASIRVVITPPWWRTPWAYALYAVILVAGVFTVARMERARAVRKEREEAQFREARLRAEAAELQSKATEAEARALRAENERKTQELEEARKLQLSMLPRELPELPHLDIAVYMKTATEVGGDYYDFHVAGDGTLTVAVGDATGHGMKAGTMVASTKSLFAAFGSSLSFVEFFNRCTEIIKVMHLGNMYMAMMLVRIQGRRLVVSSAGMPPVLIYRCQGRYVEEVVTKGMPLGGFTGYDYQQKETELGAGDAILLMTDGFPELFNEDNEMLDYPRVKKIFERAAPNSAEDIVEHLSKAAEDWSAGKPQSDDSTFVVLKVMEDAGAWS